MLYLSLDLRVSDWDPTSRDMLAEVLQSPAGEVPPQRVRLDIEPEAQGERLLYAEDNAQRLGQLLWQNVFADGIRDAWGRSYQCAIDRRRGLRLRIHTDDGRLAQLPWELLYDPARQDYVIYDRRVSIARYARIPSPQPEPITAGRLTVLVVAASPYNRPPLDWEHEVALVQSSLQELIDQGRINLVVCAHATPQGLQERLIEVMPEIVHFVGHGEYDATRQTGSLLFEDAHGDAAPLEARALARLLCRHKTQLVFLNACNTARGQIMGLAAALMRGDMPAVIAMQWPVEDEAATRFGSAFYRAVSLDLTMDECMTEGRLAISTAGGEPADWAAPVLYMRSLSGKLWLAARKTSEAEEAEAVATQASSPAAQTVPRPVTRTAEQAWVTHGPLRSGESGALRLRRDEMARILKMARQPAIAQYVVVLGSPYSGKTTLLLQVQEELRAEQSCVYSDLAALSDADLVGCLRYVAQAIAAQLDADWAAQGGPLRRVRQAVLRQASPIANALAAHPLDEITTAADWLALLEALAAASPTPRITVLLDQLDRLPADVTAGVWAALRSILVRARGTDGPLAKYFFVLAGALDLRNLASQRNSPLHVAECIYLGDLDVLQIGGILAQFATQGVHISEEAPQLVLQATGGHPYLTMQLCAWLQRHQVVSIDRQTIADAVDNMLATDEHLAATVARVAADPAASARLRQILAGERLRFTRSDPALATLELIGVITPSSPVRLRCDLYERALRAHGLAEPSPTPAASI
ncbi:MAG: CHAT domain-containing protein [Anaerolineales bacterium]